MFLLTRETRIALNSSGNAQLKPTNTHAGFPTLNGFGQHLVLRTTLSGELSAETAYLCNIKQIDDVIWQQGIMIIERAMRMNVGAANVPILLFEHLRSAWAGASLHSIEVLFSPFLSVACFAKEHPMVRLSQKFEFSAAHRLHNPALSDDENRKAFGKCNNPLGHGHNYQVKVTLTGKPGENGLLIDIATFEKIVADAAIDRFDHKFLNLEIPEFRQLIPSVENIAKVIYGLLNPCFQRPIQLASVTVWETQKTWCEYSE